MRVKVASHTRNGKTVKGYTYSRVGSRSRKKYSASQKRALEKSRTSKSGHKSWRARQKSEKKSGKRAGLWAHVHAKKAREKRKTG